MVPEHVSVPHKTRVQAGATCQTCHGPVETMAAVFAVTGQRPVNDLVNLASLAPAPRALTQGLACGLSPLERRRRDERD